MHAVFNADWSPVLDRGHAPANWPEPAELRRPRVRSPMAIGADLRRQVGDSPDCLWWWVTLGGLELHLWRWDGRWWVGGAARPRVTTHQRKAEALSEVADILAIAMARG